MPAKPRSIIAGEGLASPIDELKSHPAAVARGGGRRPGGRGDRAAARTRHQRCRRPNGFSVARGLTTPDSAEAAVKSAFVTAARRTVLLADHSKYNSAHFAHVADLSRIDVIVTDSALPDEAATELEAAGPTVIRA